MSDEPALLVIEPLRKPPRATVRVPGSKSITNRAMVLAALVNHPEGCTLQNALQSEDTEVMIAALRQLGFDVAEQWPRSLIRIARPPATEVLPLSSADLFVGNSGTTMRFLTALVSLGSGRYRLDGVPRMRERPIEDLLVSLRQLGVHAISEHNNGCPPVVVQTTGLGGGRVRIKGNVSSQFLSGLLMAAPCAGGDIDIEVDGSLVSLPYIAMTLAMIHQFGARVDRAEGNHFHIPGRQQYHLREFDIEPDASAASYFFGAAAITGGEVGVAGLGGPCLQGDIRFVEVLEAMGCTVRRDADGLTVRGGPLRGIDVDMNDISDCVMTLAAVACFAEGPTTIRNVGHIRHKETDRLQALATELRRVGAGALETADGLRIVPQPLHGAEIATYNDHRMAMSMALVGLKVPGIVIRDPGCVRKTYPGFFHDLEKLRC